MSARKTESIVFGWREFVALPDWDITRLKAKLDTGARTSAIHVGAIEHLPDGRVRFDVVVREKPDLRTRSVVAEPIRRSRVKPSHGATQERIVCRTRLRIGPCEHEIEISLVSRKGMLCRMLVGRLGLPPGGLVDPRRKYLHDANRGRRQKASGKKNTDAKEEGNAP